MVHSSLVCDMSEIYLLNKIACFLNCPLFRLGDTHTLESYVFLGNIVALYSISNI